LNCYLSYSKRYMISGDLSLKFKNLHDEILRDKVWIPTRAKMNIFRLEKLLLSCYLYFIEFGQTLLYALWEVCHTFKIKITLHTSHSHFILFHQKMFFSYTRRKHQKVFHLDFPQINAPNLLYYLSNILYERSMWLCKRKNII
jgi:hypothetical protein